MYEEVKAFCVRNFVIFYGLSRFSEVPEAQDDRRPDAHGAHAREPLPQHALPRLDCRQVAARRGRRHAQARRQDGPVR